MANVSEKITFDGRELEVDIEVSSYGSAGGWGCPPEFADPPESPEFEIVAVWDAEGEAVTLSDDDLARLDQHIAETVDFEPPAYDDDC